MPAVRGLHHITAVTTGARRNLAFWRDGLGLRLVKRTVNFDDPSAYHLYYGDALGRPGSLVTFFAWEHVGASRRGAGEVAETQLAVPAGTLDWWAARLTALGRAPEREERFGEPRLGFTDPDGLALALVEAAADRRSPWSTEAVPPEVAVRGLHGVTLALAELGPTAALLSDPLGYRSDIDDEVRRLTAPEGSAAPVVDLVATTAGPARWGAGGVHHVAFAVADQAAQEAVRDRLGEMGLAVTPPIDRDYFHAIYFRAPGGVLFEVATAAPGFTVDEAAERLGTTLRLPRRHEPRRRQLKARLPPLD